jgi:uncharacterized phage protein gp47/JayE
VATNPFLKSIDDILNGILTDFQNTFPGVDTSKLTLAFMKAAGYASATWGLYKYQEWISNQIFPDSADDAWLNHHGWVYGLTPNPGEEQPQFLARLLSTIQQPPAGGNQYDYARWAMSVPGVANAWCVPLGQGLGTVDVVILAEASSGSIIPGAPLLAAVLAYINGICPTSVQYLRVLAPTVITQNVTMTTSGPNKNPAQTTADITNYLNNFIPSLPGVTPVQAPGATLYLSQLSAIALNDGAQDGEISVPAANVATTAYEIIQAGVVTVT